MSETRKHGDFNANGVFEEKSLNEELLNHAIENTYTKNQLISDLDQEVNYVPIVLEGRVRISCGQKDQDMLLYYVEPMESCVALIHCALNGLRSTVKASAEETSRLLLIPPELVPRWREKYPSFNRYITEHYERRFFSMMDIFSETKFQSMEDRILSYLRKKSTLTNSNRIYLTHSELAADLGGARETASRTLKKLEQKSEVILGRGWIQVKDF